MTLATCIVPLGLAVLLLTGGLGPVRAHDGHDHDEAPAALSADSPRRQADGSVFLPKPSQRQIGVRTQPVELAPLARAHVLNGTVVMDPNAGGKVQAMVAGRLIPGPDGLPLIGQPVRQGQVLAYVEPANGALERSDLQAQLAELEAAHALAQKRLTRLQALSGTVPRKDIEQAQSDVASLAARAQALRSGLSGRDELTAPVDGVIASHTVVAGQVVDALELVFEVVDPTRLYIEALLYEPELAGTLAGAYVKAAGRSVALSPVGVGTRLRGQALPVLYRIQDDNAVHLALGQTVTVIAQEAETISGYRVPTAAIVKNPANQDIVWVKVHAEHFEPRTVTVVPLDGVSVAISSGLQPGDRVVIMGAPLINQIR